MWENCSVQKQQRCWAARVVGLYRLWRDAVHSTHKAYPTPRRHGPNKQGGKRNFCPLPPFPLSLSARRPNQPCRPMGTSSAALCRALLGHAEELNAKLLCKDDLGDLPQKLVEADAAIQAQAAKLLDQRDRQAKALALNQQAEEAQAALLRRTNRMHKTKYSLADSIQRAENALASSDAAKNSKRAKGIRPETVVEYAERISYSNAAPCSQVAFDGAMQSHFFEGWGTPTPQQNMLGASRFASGQPAAADYVRPVDDGVAAAGASSSTTDASQQPATSAAATGGSSTHPVKGTSSGVQMPPPPPPVAAAQPSFRTAAARGAEAEEQDDEQDLGFGDSDDDDDDEFD